MARRKSAKPAPVVSRADLRRVLPPKGPGRAPAASPPNAPALAIVLGPDSPLHPAPAKRPPRDGRPAGASPTEHAEQAEFFSRCEKHKGTRPELAEFFAVPNGAYKSRAARAKFQAEGLKAGVEDVLLLVARGGYHGLLLEFKRSDGKPSDVSDAQREWHRIHTRRGYKVVVAYGCAEAWEAALAYLLMPKTRVAFLRDCPAMGEAA